MVAVIKPIHDNTPRDRPILAFCVHVADSYFEPGGSGRLTTYGAHCEGLGHVDDGWHVLVFGGQYVEDDHYTPAWWFLSGSDFEVVANPICWIDAIPHTANVGSGDER